MVDIMTKPFMKYANETHTGVFEVPPSQQNEILDTGMIKNSTAVRKRIQDKNALGEQFGLKPSVFVNPKKVVEVKYGLGLSKEKNREAVYKWRATEVRMMNGGRNIMKGVRKLIEGLERRNRVVRKQRNKE